MSSQSNILDSSTSSGAYLLNPASQYSSSTSVATTDTSLFMQHLQQIAATSVPSSHQPIFMNELLLKQATAALAAQHLDTGFSQPMDRKAESAPSEMSQLSIKLEDDSKIGNICCVCSDEASGRHYGSVTCFGCKVRILTD